MKRNWNLIGRLAEHIAHPQPHSHFDCNEEEVRFTLRLMEREKMIVPVEIRWTDEELRSLAQSGASSTGDGYRYLDTTGSRGGRGGVATPLFRTHAITRKGRDIARVVSLPEIDLESYVDPRSRELLRLRGGLR
jgi:hypothetical protein